MSAHQLLLLSGASLPSLDLDFTKGVLPAGMSFSRASVGTYFDATGTLRTAANNVPRFDYDPVTHVPLGLLVEGQSTNFIPNNTAQGAVVGNPGTLPTGYGFSSGNGLTAAVAAVGAINGISYFDVHVFGTTGSGSFSNLTFASGALIAVAQGQTWTPSVYLALVGGSTTNITSITYGASVLNSSLVYLGEVATRPDLRGVLNSTLTRFAYTGTISPATAAFIGPYLQIAYASGGGVTIDVTLRIGMPQAEQQSFATSVIPTSGAAATRAADIILAPLGGWYRPSAGTSLVAMDFEGLGPVFISQEILGVGSGANNIDRLLSNGTNAVPLAQTVIANTPIFTLAPANHFSAGGVQKIALSYSQGGASKALAVNAGSPVSGTATQALTGANTLYLGGSGRGGQLCGHLRRVKYWPRALSAAELVAVTR
jgi:hypothetical protein